MRLPLGLVLVAAAAIAFAAVAATPHASPSADALSSSRPAPNAYDQELSRGLEEDGPEAVEEFFTGWFGLLGFPMVPSDRADLRDAYARMPSETPDSPTLFVGGWEFVGPLAISSLIAYPNQAWSNGRVNWFEDLAGFNRYRIAAPTGGLWEVDGNTANPIPLSDNIDVPFGLVCGSFATDPLDEDTIIMGSGAQSFGNGSGVWKTDDGGMTWTSIPLSDEPGVFYRVRYDPNNHLRVHLATSNGLWLSTDGGDHFARIMSGSVTEVLFVPWDPLVVYVVSATGEAGSGIWRSDDGGDIGTYTRLTAGGAPIDDVKRTSLAVAPYLTAPEVTAIYASMDRGSGPKAYKSANDGMTWDDITPSDTKCMVQGGYANSIAVDPYVPDYIVMGWVCLYWSNDGGQTWRIADGIHSDFHALGFEGGTLYAGNDAGLQNGLIPGMLTTNFNWLTPVWFPIAQCFDSDISEDDPEKALFGMQDNGIARTPALIGDGGIVQWKRGGDALSVATNPQAGAAWFAVDIADTLPGPLKYWNYTGQNEGDVWGDANSGLQPTQLHRRVVSPRVAVPGRRIVTFAEDRVYGSTDEGATWTDLTPTPIGGMIHDISIADDAGDNIWVTTNKVNSSLTERVDYRKDDGTWAERSSALPNFLPVVRVAPADPLGSRPLDAYALIGPGDSITPGDGKRVFYTDDAGVTWDENLSGNIPGKLPIFDIVENPSHPSILYLATAAGVMRTENRGALWAKWNIGWPSGVMVTRLQVVHDITTGGYELYATTFGRGVWRRDVTDDIPTAGLPVAASPTLGFRVLQNPGTGSAEFGFSLVAPGPVRIDIVDVEGRRVRSLRIDATAGGNRTVWDGRDDAGKRAAAGVYFATLRKGAQTSSTRFVLMR